MVRNLPRKTGQQPAGVLSDDSCRGRNRRQGTGKNHQLPFGGGFAVGSLHHQRNHVRSHPVHPEYGQLQRHSGSIDCCFGCCGSVVHLHHHHQRANQRIRYPGLSGCGQRQACRHGPDRRCADGLLSFSTRKLSAIMRSCVACTSTFDSSALS